MTEAWQLTEQDAAPRRRTALEVMTSSESAEWYTPRRYLEAVREVLGAIDLDPASCELANRTVRATRIFTAADDGLTRTWRGRVFLNMPYGRRDGDHGPSNQAVWSARLLDAYATGTVEAGVALVNAETGSAWFQRLWEHWVCLTDHRIRFVDELGRPSTQPTKSNAFVYVGPHGARFERVFARFGRVIPPLASGIAQGRLL